MAKLNLSDLLIPMSKRVKFEEKIGLVLSGEERVALIRSEYGRP